MKKTVIYLLLLLFPFMLSAQHWCGADKVFEEELRNNPEKRKEVEKFEEAWRKDQVYKVVKHAMSRSFRYSPLASTQYHYDIDYNKTYIIPLVFHVIHDTPFNEAKEAEMNENIEKFVRYVNEVFAGIEVDTKGPRNGGVFAPIQFALARRDINNNPTNGIVHVDASHINKYVIEGMGDTGIPEAEVRQLSAWDENYFLNIYMINKFSGESNTLAYAYRGGAGTTFTRASEVRVGCQTIPHELGHSLNLLHTFHTGSTKVCPANDNCLEDNDMICDTEVIKTLFELPPSNAENPCTGETYKGGPENLMNYLYKPDRFTPGQVHRMIFELENNPIKQNLLKHKMYLPPITGMAATCTPFGILEKNNNYNMGPARIKFGDLNYVSRGYNYDGNQFYLDHTKFFNTKFIAGKEYPIEVSVETNSQKVFAYIDYNNNGVFEDSEGILYAQLNATKERPESYRGKVLIPLNAVKNVPLRMRVVADWKNANYDPKCAFHEDGQTEDFAIMIIDPAPNEESLPKTGINTTTPETTLEIKSTDNGVVFPKMNNKKMWNIKSPAAGMLIYNTSEHCLAMNYGTEIQPLWRCLDTKPMN